MSHVKFEIPADDLKRASEFYKEVFGCTMDLPFNYGTKLFELSS